MGPICLFFMLESHDFTKTCKTKIFSSFRRFKKSDPHVGGKNRIRIRSKRSEFASTACRNTIERHFNIEEIIFCFMFPTIFASVTRGWAGYNRLAESSRPGFLKKLGARGRFKYCSHPNTYTQPFPSPSFILLFLLCLHAIKHF